MLRGNRISPVIIGTIFAAVTVANAGLVADPEVFDFGWAPNDARITCEFVVTNQSDAAISLSSMRPACGCTTSEFTPGALASQEKTVVGMTFNTRGYDGATFQKPASLETGSNQTRIKVHVKGHVNNNNAQVRPTGTGIASFEPGNAENIKKIKIKNFLDKEVILKTIQSSANWAIVNPTAKRIGPHQMININVTVNPPYDKNRHTSATFEALDGVTAHRFTVAVRTGPLRKRYIRPPQQPPKTP